MTDWWMVAATLLSGFFAAGATIVAVLYTNSRTQKQLLEEQLRRNKEDKYVIIKPSYQFCAFIQILDSLIVNNDYNRVLLVSGDDGFDFYDDPQKQGNQFQRIFIVQNPSDNDIKNIRLKTDTILRNNSSNKKTVYSTSNQIKLLRSKEKVVIRIASEEQLLDIEKMVKESVSSELNFSCQIEYETFAKQRVRYEYQMTIHDNTRIEITKDGVESVEDIKDETEIKQSVCRNLQDSISFIDRRTYAWRKMGQAQAEGAFGQMIQLQNQNSKKQSPTENYSEVQH